MRSPLRLDYRLTHADLLDVARRSYLNHYRRRPTWWIPIVALAVIGGIVAGFTVAPNSDYPALWIVGTGILVAMVQVVGQRIRLRRYLAEATALAIPPGESLACSLEVAEEGILLRQGEEVEEFSWSEVASVDEVGEGVEIVGVNGGIVRATADAFATPQARRHFLEETRRFHSMQEDRHASPAPGDRP